MRCVSTLSTIPDSEHALNDVFDRATAGMGKGSADLALIFATSYGYFDPHVLAVAKKYPAVRFAHCGGLWNKDKHPINAGSYFGYIAECQYLNGVAAAHASKSKKIGFIAAKPIPQVLQNINAFTLGARSVDPRC